MIKRIIGIIGTLGVVAIVVFTILGREHYSSAIDFSHVNTSVAIKSEVDNPEVVSPETYASADENIVPTDSVDTLVVNRTATE